MNELDVVVGSSEAVNFFDHAFVWQGGVMTDLHALSGVPGRNSHARAINELGVIVGSADFVADFIDFETACVWVGGVVTNFGSLGGSESFAHAINDHGTIVGTSITADFFVHAIIIRDGVLTDLNDLIPPGTGWTLANAYDIGNDGVIVGEGFSPAGLQAFRLEPNTDGTFQVYGQGCPGSLGITPGLYGQGFPTSGGSIDLALVNGVGGGLSLLLLGAGTGSAPFKPGCDLQILPLLPASVTLPLGGGAGAAGEGFWQLGATLPPALQTFDLTLQAILQDPGVIAGLTLSNPLKMHIE
jgi:probable HAF family extracellular repeat protein